MLNRVDLIGRTGADAELRYIPSGTAVANVSIATTEKYKDKETTEWHRVTFWGKLAEIAGQYIKKGGLVFISGRLHYDSYEKDGQKVYKTEIIAEKMRLLSGKGEVKPAMDDDETLPF